MLTSRPGGASSTLASPVNFPYFEGREMKQRNFTVALLLSFFLGGLGGDRFYLGYPVLGVLKLITLGGCGIWWLVDFIRIVVGKLPDADGNSLAR